MMHEHERIDTDTPRDDIEGLRIAFEEKILGVNDYFAYGRTFLHMAARDADVVKIKFLLSMKANVNIKTVNGLTPLLCAMMSMDEETITTLLDHEADPNLSDHQDMTPWLLAYMIRAHLGINFMSLLERHGVKTPIEGIENDIRCDGLTKLWLLTYCGRYNELESVLEQHEDDVNEPVSESCALASSLSLVYSTPIMIAAFMDDIEAVRLLVEYGADINAFGSMHCGVLTYAARYGYLELARVLIIEYGANVNLHHTLKNSPSNAFNIEPDLYVAVLYNQPDMVRFFLEQKADPNEVIWKDGDDAGTVWHLAVCENRYKCFLILMEFAKSRFIQMPDFDMEDDNGNTVLGRAIDYIDRAKYLAPLLQLFASESRERKAQLERLLKNHGIEEKFDYSVGKFDSVERTSVFAADVPLNDHPSSGFKP